MSDKAFGGQRAVDNAGHAAHPDCYRRIRRSIQSSARVTAYSETELY